MALSCVPLPASPGCVVCHEALTEQGTQPECWDFVHTSVPSVKLIIKAVSGQSEFYSCSGSQIHLSEYLQG